MTSRVEREIVWQALSWNQNKLYHSTCETLVASHYPVTNPDGLGSGRYNLSKDLLEVRTEETFQGQTASLVILPTRPYHHWIFPGDWVSIYFNTGIDDRSDFGVVGFPGGRDDDIRCFFGFVDSIIPSVTVDQKGQAVVRFNMTCSGIQKAFDRTTIYHNPQLSPETLFGAILPGLANLSRGITMSGTPATIPRSIALAYLGFGGQFTMPSTYANKVASEDVRKERVRALLRRAQSLERSLGFVFSEGEANKSQQPGLVERSIKAAQEEFEGNSIAQVLDLFTYVEDLHVDGRIYQTPVHDLGGNLWQLMVENSNPPMNECFVTLLPDDGGVLRGDKDEWGKSPKYVPALVIREKPFSWVDGRAYRVSRANTEKWNFKVPSMYGKDQDVVFGDIFFSSRVHPAFSPRMQRFKGVTGNYQTGQQGAYSDLISSGLAGRDRDSRFIERVIIRSSDIGSESLGLSDTDHFNFFTVSSACMGLSQTQQKYLLLQDGLIPIFLPESIKRYGLRVKDVSTKFMHQGGAKLGGKAAMNFLIRTMLAHDIWYQHQMWYDRGTVTVKPLPRARVGMALDIIDRDMSYYIEGVAQTWNRSADSGVGRLATTLTLTRGQPGWRKQYERFNYAPPDPVKMFIGQYEIPRRNLAKQPITRRSPYATTEKQVDRFLSSVVSSDSSGLTSQQINEFSATLDALTGYDSTTGTRKTAISVPLIRKALEKTSGVSATVQKNLNDKFQADISERALPPVFKAKEDRANAAKPPWVVQEELRGKKYDPIRRRPGSEESPMSAYNEASNILQRELSQKG